MSSFHHRGKRVVTVVEVLSLANYRGHPDPPLAADELWADDLLHRRGRR